MKGLLDRLVYLSTGLAIILAFIGVKLVLHWAHGTSGRRCRRSARTVSLVVIVVVLTITTVASLIKSRKDPAAKAHAGSLRNHAKSGDRAAPSIPLMPFARHPGAGRGLPSLCAGAVVRRPQAGWEP